MAEQIVHVDGPVRLVFRNGPSILVMPSQARAAPAAAPEQAQDFAPGAAGAPRRGRKPSPATRALVEQMQKDHNAGLRSDVATYVAFLQRNGHGASEASARAIVNREAKRIFGAEERPAAGGTRGATSKARVEAGVSLGRMASRELVELRKKLRADKDAGNLRDAGYYLGWAMDQKGNSWGLRKAKPIVRRELKQIRIEP